MILKHIYNRLFIRHNMGNISGISFSDRKFCTFLFYSSCLNRWKMYINCMQCNTLLEAGELNREYWERTHEASFLSLNLKDARNNITFIIKAHKKLHPITQQNELIKAFYWKSRRYRFVYIMNRIKCNTTMPWL